MIANAYVIIVFAMEYLEVAIKMYVLMRSEKENISKNCMNVLKIIRYGSIGLSSVLAVLVATYKEIEMSTLAEGTIPKFVNETY